MVKRTIRHSKPDDISTLLYLIDCGRKKMRAIGNNDQWTNGDPRREILEEDIRKGNSYLMEEGGNPIATFAFVPGPDVTYAQIYEGNWLDDELPYYVIHRMASIPDAHGIMKDALDYCFQHTNNIRIDTHRQNSAMRGVIEKHGFQYCGIIYLLDGAERLAFQKIINDSEKER